MEGVAKDSDWGLRATGREKEGNGNGGEGTNHPVEHTEIDSECGWRGEGGEEILQFRPRNDDGRVFGDAMTRCVGDGMGEEGDDIADRPGINHGQSIQVGGVFLADPDKRDRWSRSGEKERKKERKDGRKGRKRSQGELSMNQRTIHDNTSATNNPT